MLLTGNRFCGKIAVVSGGNSGIGLTVAKQLSKEGARVVITGRDEKTLRAAEQDIGGDVIAIRSDVRDVKQIRTLFEQVERNPGRIDFLFVNAGVGILKRIELVSENDWDTTLDTNLKGAFFTVQHALPLMHSGANVILTGSIAALIGEPEGSVYAASKAGLRALGRSLAAELVERGIRVNVVSPGTTETPMFKRINGLDARAMASMRDEMIGNTPMKRLGTTEDVAAAVLFLASEAAGFVTGSELLVDGGAGSF